MVSDIELAEQWLSETFRQIRTMISSLPKELGVTAIDISDKSLFIHGIDENGEYVISRMFYEGCEGIFLDERFYPEREVEEDGTTEPEDFPEVEFTVW